MAGSTPGDASASPAFWLAALVLAGLAGLAFHLAPQLPFGVAFDEPLKVHFVKDGTQDFHHPILMLQMVRAANFFVGASDEAGILAVGRAAAAFSGGLLVFAAILLARRAMGNVAAFGAGLLTAVAPLTVLHAQLFKEDIFLAPWLIFGLVALDRLVAKPERLGALLFGAAAGLAAAAKYTGAILLPLSLLPPLWESVDRKRYFRLLALALAVAILVFLAVNLPAFTDPLAFATGIRGELGHALGGHLIVLYGWQSWFLFTWFANLWPGLTAPLALAGLIGAGIVVVTWWRAPAILRLLLAFGLAWYLLHELPPMKPYPEGARHMVVMAAAFAVLAAFAAERLTGWLPRDAAAAMATAAILAIAAHPALVSYRLVQSAPDDTQLVTRRIAASLPGPTLWARPTTVEPSLELSGPLDEVLSQPGFLVVNELFADQYVKSLSLSLQTPIKLKRAAAHEALMRRPALRVTSTAGSFAFRNPPYRIVALSGDPRALADVAKAYRDIPDISLEVVPAR